MEDYHLVNQIGEGSFGRVYKARRKYTGRLVAIKMINKLGQSKDDIISFRREIDLLQKVSHPNIMRMLNMFETDTDFCVVSELARGDLFQVIDDNQTLPESILKNVAAQLVSAMSHLHSHHIIHRDMKPQNILIAEKGSLKICDFGFARALSNTTLVLTSIKGTPLYMAPELVQEQPYDEKVDIWALGVILYELYYGKPPFFTNSIYKLIQMIVNSPITWPGDISKQFKSFLLEMLQKDPHQRTSCEDLMKHPFIADVELSHFDDRVYRFKSEQFERAIKESLMGGSRQTFKPPKSKVPDFQMIFVNPASHSDEELLLALKYLRENNIPADSPLAASFSFHFSQFISRKEVIDEALHAAADLLRKDMERFATQFASGVTLLGSPEMSIASIDFFTELLTTPFAQNIIQNNDFQLGDLQLDEAKCDKLRDKLLSFLFSNDNELVGKTYVVLSFFAQESPLFLERISGSFAPQFIPIITSAVIMNQSPLVQTSALCILSKVIDANNATIQYIQPFGKFLDAFQNIVNSEITSIQALNVFSAALSFIAVTLNTLSEQPEFSKRYDVRASLTTLPNFLNMVFRGKHGVLDRLKALLVTASMPPSNEIEILSYAPVLSSPFCHIPMEEAFVDICAENITGLLPFHQPALLGTLFALQPKRILPLLPKLVPLYSQPTCANLMSEYILENIGTPNVQSQVLVEQLVEVGILPMISTVICDFGPAVPANVVIVLAQIILTFKKPTQTLVEQSTEILNSVFSVDCAVESSLIIASHFARLSKEFLPALSECGALNLTERALQSEVPQIRSKGLDFIGNICRHVGLPDEYLQDLIPLLVMNLREFDQTCQKLAAFALGNALLWTPEVGQSIMEDIEAVKILLESSDPKIVENAAGLCGNLVRKSNKYVAQLIKNGVLETLARTVEINPELEGKTILHLASFCQYDEARKYLSQIGISKSIAKYANSPNDRVQRYAKSIISSLQ